MKLSPHRHTGVPVRRMRVFYVGLRGGGDGERHNKAHEVATAGVGVEEDDSDSDYGEESYGEEESSNEDSDEESPAEA